MTQQMKTMEITLTRTIPASVDEVFDAWMDPNLACNPWHDADKLIFDPKIDGLFYCLMHTKEHGGIPHFGRFKAIDRPRKIEHTWMSPYTRGLESVVTVTLQKKGEDTLFTLRHADLPDDEYGRLHEEGWGSYLVNLEKAFAKRTEKVAS